MDVLGDIFHTLKLRGALYFRTDFSPPWGVTVPEHDNAARFHLVMQGRCFVQTQDSVVTLNAGDLLLVPQGAKHILSHTPNQAAPALEQILTRAAYQGDGVLALGEGDPKASTQMVCGHFSFRAGADHPILQALPGFIHLSASCRAKNPILDDLLRLISQRVFAESLGAEATISRLSETVFLEVLRSGVEEAPRLQDVLRSMRDPQIMQSLQLIHGRPDDSWTVELLAEQVAMSRSRFAKRFNELMGVGPMSYLNDWRLQKAVSLLENSSISVQQVAEAIGYQSAAAFSRAFSGKFGSAPSQFRSSNN